MKEHCEIRRKVILILELKGRGLALMIQHLSSGHIPLPLVPKVKLKLKLSTWEEEKADWLG